MNDILVSIVVPVYKTEKYLTYCMESILQQRWKNIEIILINDGSPDNAPILCDDYAKKYSHVRVVHKKNEGRGAARNSGLEEAKGKYVYFVDSDDALEDEYTVERLVKCGEENKADIIVGGFRRFGEDYISGVNHHYLQKESSSKTGRFRFRGFYQYGHLAYNWGKLYRKDFLLENEIKCPAYQFTEDKVMNWYCYVYEPTYAFVEESVYRYRENEESITYQYQEYLLPLWITVAKDFTDFLRIRGLENKYEDLIDFHFFFGSFFLAKQELARPKGLIKAAKKMREYGKSPLVRHAMNNLARGKHLECLPNLGWKIMVLGASMLYSIHGYYLYALGIAVLRKMALDKRITKRRYSR